MVLDRPLLINTVHHQVTDICVIDIDHVIKALDRGHCRIKNMRPVLPRGRKEDSQAFTFAFGRDNRQFEDIFSGPENLCTVNKGFHLRTESHAVDRGGEDNAVRFNYLVVIRIHPVMLDALVEFFARVAPLARVDICLGERNLLYSRRPALLPWMQASSRAGSPNCQTCAGCRQTRGPSRA